VVLDGSGDGSFEHIIPEFFGRLGKITTKPVGVVNKLPRQILTEARP
jgi:hypothetical protein